MPVERQTDCNRLDFGRLAGLHRRPLFHRMTSSTAKSLQPIRRASTASRRCSKNPSSGTTTVENGGSEDLWPLVRTPRPNGAADAIAIMRTAETTQSDPDLAGLMIRCQEKARLEVLLALVRPLPPRSKRDVTVNLGASESVLHAEVLPVGTALLLPIDATTFTTGPWRDLKQFSVRISDPEGDIRGVISLEGIRPAMARLAASCPSG